MLVRLAVVGAIAVPFAVGAAQPTNDPPAEGTEVTRFADPEIVESSGLAVVDGRFVTINDSGDPGRLFVVDPATGETVGVTRWEPDPVDVEAVAPVVEDGAATSEVWVADIGDNFARRDSVEVLRVPVAVGDVQVDPVAYELVYPDGPRDAESLLTDPATGRLYVVSKGPLGGSFYAAPEVLDADAPNELELLTAAPVMATDAAFLPDGRHLVVRGYVNAHVYSFPALEDLGSFVLPSQPQGEGVGVDPDDPDAVLLTSEGLEQPILRVEIPERLRALMDPADPDAPVDPELDGADGTGRSDDGAEPDPAGGPPVWVPVGIVGLIGGGVLAALAIVLVRGARRR
ncbi:hypothetical protein RDV89_03000 [Nocardioides zeae]|uniref:WD40 repeat domain-containing protein n=1 Tax=Nocardioides imazamoxiresistens TaxID=3231893 RepID=A0ABU3PS45_9ACTN|nr:hypothetical protein [Nocardioides zeae]MDT9592018.1 hypothetical protein [Nocardioides zeae]